MNLNLSKLFNMDILKDYELFIGQVIDDTSDQKIDYISFCKSILNNNYKHCRISLGIENEANLLTLSIWYSFIEVSDWIYDKNGLKKESYDFIEKTMNNLVKELSLVGLSHSEIEKLKKVNKDFLKENKNKIRQERIEALRTAGEIKFKFETKESSTIAIKQYLKTIVMNKIVVKEDFSLNIFDQNFIENYIEDKTIFDDLLFNVDFKTLDEFKNIMEIIDLNIKK